MALLRRFALTRSAAELNESRELLLAIVAIIAVICIGTIGYIIVEGWSFFDALYMTVITLTTVGYREVHPLSTAGRVFTLAFILVGVGVALATLTLIATVILKRQIRWIFGRKQMTATINALDGHTILCGYGRLTRIVAAELQASGLPLLIIENDIERVRLTQEAGYLVIEGDATKEQTLCEAGVKKAKRLVSLLPKDADNLYVVLTSRELNPGLYIVSRCEAEAGEKRLRRAGANRIVAPYLEGGRKIASGVLKPYVTEFIELAVSGSQGELVIEEIMIPEQSPIIGTSLVAANIKARSNITVVAMISEGGQMVTNPAGNTIVEGGSTLIGIGNRADFKLLEEMIAPQA